MNSASIASLRALGQILIVIGSIVAVIFVLIVVVTPVSPLMFLACTLALGALLFVVTGIMLRGLALAAQARTER